MPGMGPAPKHPSQRRRRNQTPALRQLPAEGRKGRAPTWPLSKPSRAESTLWAQLWRKPQAVAWERSGSVRVVARYVRVCVCAENLIGLPTTMTESRQLEDRLMLTDLALRRAGYEIAVDELAERRETSRAPARERPRIVDPKLVSAGN